MRYTFDETKRRANIAVRGIDFLLAENFVWDSALVVEDTRSDYGERRFIALGLVGARVHVLVFTPRGETVRIISLRKANRREVARYEQKT